jgi:hypothetical protein
MCIHLINQLLTNKKQPMKVYIVITTIIGNWVEDFQDSVFTDKVFSTLEKAEEYINLQPKEVPNGYIDNYQYDDEGNICGSEWESQYNSPTHYRIVETEVL